MAEKEQKLGILVEITNRLIVSKLIKLLSRVIITIRQYCVAYRFQTEACFTKFHFILQLEISNYQNYLPCSYKLQDLINRSENKSLDNFPWEKDQAIYSLC